MLIRAASNGYCGAWRDKVERKLATNSKALLTFGTGPMRAILDRTRPTFNWFAQRHAYDLIVGDVPRQFSRPVPWAKISLLRDALERYELVLWLDADTIILDDSADPAELMPGGAFQAMVRHESATDVCPNTGVWLLRAGPAATEFLDHVWRNERFTDDPWWENAAVIDLLGYTLRPTKPAKPSVWLHGTHWLPAEWNSHVGWNGLVPARIRHYAGISNSERIRNMTIDLHGAQARRSTGAARYLRFVQYAWGELRRRPLAVFRALDKRFRAALMRALIRRAQP